MSFAGKIAIVTGGGSGIGRAICVELARHGATVVAADVDEDAARATVALVTEAGAGAARAARVDVTDAESVRAVIAETVSTDGRLDLMFNNAGISALGEIRDLTLEHWRRVIDVNLFGVIHGTHHAYAQMVRQGHGHIVNTASGFGLVPGPINTPYVASKWAVVGLTESLRAEGADLGVKASVVCPGLIRTPLLDTMPVVGATAKQWMELFPFRASEPDWAARKILAGVRRGKAVIAFPFSVRLFVWLYRSWPRLAAVTTGRAVSDFRKIRKIAEPPGASDEQAPPGSSVAQS